MRAILLGLMLVAGPAWSSEINLLCYGDGTRTVVSSQATDNTAAASSRSFGFGDQVDIRIYNGSGRIRIPRAMLPQEYSGDQDGWWTLTDLNENEREIRARVRFNFMNKPNIRIDRLTGHLSIDAGRAQFSGRCERFDPLNAKPKF